MITEERLRNLPPFADLSTAERNMLTRILDEATYEERATLVTQGDYGYEFMVIEEGTVEVIHNGERIDTMGPGDFFGELAVIGDGVRRNATIVATSPVRVLRLTAHDMRTVRDRMPRIGEQIDSVISARRHEDDAVE